MHFKAKQSELARAVASAARVVGNRSTLPVLANVLVEAEAGGRVKLQGTDREVGLTVWVDAEVGKEGKITLPGKMLSELIGQFPDEVVEVWEDVGKVAVKIKCGRYVTILRGIDASDFPVVPSDITGSEILVGNDFAGAIRQVLFATAQDESRPTLGGVYLKVEGNDLVLAATDGFRLAEKKVAIGQALEGEAIVPRRAMAEIERLVKDAEEDEDVRLGIWKNRFGVATRKAVIVASVVDANFPNYRAIIPKGYTTRVTVEVAKLLKAVQVSWLFARDSHNIVRFVVGRVEGEASGFLDVSAVSAETGNSSAVVGCLMDGDEMEIAFNGKYLQEAVKACQESAPLVVLEMTRSNAPGLLYPEGDGTVRMVVMPMHFAK